MSIFDKLKKTVEDTVKSTAAGAVNSIGNKKETFTFRALPESVAELQALPEAVPVDGQELQEWEKGTVARLYKLPGALGNVGLISAMSAHFCGTCNRLRLTADGHIRPCLHDTLEFSIKGCTNDEMREQFIRAVREKPCGNPMIFGHGNTVRPKDRVAEEGRSMNRIGG